MGSALGTSWEIGGMTELVVAFDFDGTLSDSEMTVLLGEQQGVGADMRRITDRAMNDEIGYAESLRTRVALLEGLDRDAVEAAFSAVRLRPGASEILSRLGSTSGVCTAILTGGFDDGVAHALSRDGVNVDYIIANRLVEADGHLTGDVDGPLIEGTKDEALEALVTSVDSTLEGTIAVGDGANDLPMLEVAGLAVGFLPKPAVEPACDVIVRSMAELAELIDGELDHRGLE